MKETAQGVLLLLVSILLSFSQVISKIEVEGNRYLTEELIKSLLLSKEGTRFSVERVREDIRRLFSTGFFRNIEVYKEGEKEVKLIYKVEDLPVIYSIEFRGNDEIDSDDLSKQLGIETQVGELDPEEVLKDYTSSPAIEEKLVIQRKLKLGRVLSRKEIEDIKRRIKDIYLEEGYPEVKISYRIIPKKGASKLLFIIEEGHERFVGDISFEGNESFSSRRLKKLMKTEDRNILFLRWKPTFSEEVLKEDIKTLRQFYRNEGFLEAKVSYRVEAKNGRRDIKIFIKEGPRYRLSRLDIEGNEMFAYSELVEDYLRKNKGGYYRREVLENIKKNIKLKYSDIGFMRVRVQEQKHVNFKDKSVSVKLRIEEGKPVYVEKIEIKGNYETRDYVLRREMRIHEGSLASKKSMDRSRTRILSLGYYDDVSLTPIPRDEERWDLLMKVRERFTGQFSVGLSYNQVTGLSGFLSAKKGNFRGTGDIIGGSISYGSQYRDNSISYTRKWFLNRPMDLSGSIFDKRVEYTTYTVQRTGFTVDLSKEFREFWRWSVGISAQRISYSDIDDDASSFIKNQEGTRDSRKVFLTVKRDTRDYYLFPRKGSLTELYTSLAVPVLGGTEKFFKLRLSHATYWQDRIFDTGLILSGKGTVGFVEGYGGAEVPLDERFFVGGDFTIRGYDYGYAGTIDANGDPIGSTKELFFNFEANYPITNMVYVGAFLDIGMGAENWGDFKPGNLRGGVGFGIRLITPFAPIKIDFAYKLKRVPGDDSPTRVHFILGGYF